MNLINKSSFGFFFSLNTVLLCILFSFSSTSQKLAWGPTAAYSAHYDLSANANAHPLGNYSFGLWVQNKVQRKLGFALSLEKGLENVKSRIDNNTFVNQNYDFWKAQVLVGFNYKRFSWFAGFAPRYISSMDLSLALTDKANFRSFSYKYSIWNNHKNEPLRKFQLSPIFYTQYSFSDAFHLMIYVEHDVFSMLTEPLVVSQGLYNIVLLNAPFRFNAHYSRIGLRALFLIPSKSK